MLMLIGNLPRDVTLVELGRVLDHDNLKVRGSSHHGKRIDKSVYHCILVDTESDGVGHQLIKQIDGLKLGDNILSVRRYIDRAKSSGWQGENRRIKQLNLDFPEENISNIR
jgi:hypothetical protein